MKFFTTTFILAMLLSVGVSAMNSDEVTDPVTDGKSRSALSKIFYSDYDNTTMFIDFELLGNQFNELNIVRDGKLMLKDDISDLSESTIYEINLEIMRKGTYTLELVTQEGIKITKEFVIN